MLWDGLGFFGTDHMKLGRLRGEKVTFYTPLKSPQKILYMLAVLLVFIYFMIGMVVGAATTMVGLSLLRPYLPDAGWVRWLVVAPLFIGGIIGMRTARIGAQERRPLSHALRGALGLGRR